MRRYFFFFAFAFTVASACTGNRQNASYFSSQIDSLNRNVSRGVQDTTRVHRLSNDLMVFVNKNETDTAAPRLLFELARTQQNHGMYERGILTLRELRSRYPQSGYASKALMLEGFVEANVLHNYDAARRVYTEYLDRYRDVDPKMSRDVEMELQHMGKTPEEIIAEIEARQGGDTSLRVMNELR